MQISISFGIFCGSHLHLLDFYFKHVEINRKALNMGNIGTYKCFRPRFAIVKFVNQYILYLFLHCANTQQQTNNLSHLDRSWKSLYLETFWILIVLSRVLFQQMQRCFCCPSKRIFHFKSQANSNLYGRSPSYSCYSKLILLSEFGITYQSSMYNRVTQNAFEVCHYLSHL